jgi:hypothetical protein
MFKLITIYNASKRCMIYTVQVSARFVKNLLVSVKHKVYLMQST